MSDYTPTTDEVRMAYGDVHCMNLDDPAHTHGCPQGAAFDRWLAAHDAEVRAAVLAELGEPEWEYRYAEIHDDGSMYTYGPRDNPDGSFQSVEAARAETVEDTDIVVHRVVSPWLPVEQEGKTP